MSPWVGCSVSIHCGDTLGTYQGKIIEVTDSTITLNKAFRNGLPYPRPEVALNSSDIQNIEFIEMDSSSTEYIESGRSIVTVAKPIPKRASKVINLTDSFSLNKNGISPPNNTNPLNNGTNNVNTVKPKPIESPKMSSDFYECDTFKKDKNRPARWRKGWKDEACFGTPLDKSLQKDFDFEKNLKLFNKQAIWDELNAAQKPDVIRQTDKRAHMKYRHDENIITALPTVFREIEVSVPDMREYVTDSGLIVPSITSDLQNRLLTIAERYGFSFERRAEILGRAATEMVLQLLGGGYRLNPHNAHQAPTVVALCGPHKHGAVGLNALRQLVSHGVNTVAYMSGLDLSEEVMKEYNLYKLTKNKYTSKVLDLPSTVDLIILALCEDTDNPPSYPLLSEWTNQNRAPVLALDPPSVGTPGISAKFSLVPVLPLSHSPDNGNIYLCNLGIPLKVFEDAGIKYKSPFGPKFVIPLHPNDT